MDWAIYGALIVAALASGAAAVFIAIRGLAAWRDLKRLQGRLGDELEALAERSDRTGEIVERVSDQRELEAHVERLRVSLARFAVLREAMDEVSESLGRVTSVYPRK